MWVVYPTKFCKTVVMGNQAILACPVRFKIFYRRSVKARHSPLKRSSPRYSQSLFQPDASRRIVVCANSEEIVPVVAAVGRSNPSATMSRVRDALARERPTFVDARTRGAGVGEIVASRRDARETPTVD